MQRLRSGEWAKLAKQEFGITTGRFFELKNQLQGEGKVHQSRIDARWEQIQTNSGNPQGLE